MNRTFKNFLISTFLIASDFLSLVVSFFISMFFISFPHDFNAIIVPGFNWKELGLLHAFISLLCIGWFTVRLRHYFYRKTFWLELKEIYRTLIIFSVIEMAIVAFSNAYFYKVFWLITWLVAVIFLPLFRFLSKRILTHFGLWERDTYIIGTSDNAKDAYYALLSESNLGFNVIGFVNVGGKKCAEQILGKDVINPTDEWLSTVDKKIQFIIAVESNESMTRNFWLKEFMINGFRFVSVIPTLRGMPLDSTDLSFIFSHEIMIFRVHYGLAKVSSRVTKRIFDVFFSALGIILLSPLFVYISFMIMKDGGPAIYGHDRIGKNGRKFKCLKFRSMVTNSQEVLISHLNNSEIAKKEWDLTFKLKDDPRVTQVGKFLRQTSLDELPQLFNVLLGQMSLVGPRPVIKQELERYSDQVEYYLLARPGMTGLWQVSGRSDVDYETRVYFDSWYVKNWSMWNDISILFKTISVVFKKDGAY